MPGTFSAKAGNINTNFILNLIPLTSAKKSPGPGKVFFVPSRVLRDSKFEFY